MKKLLRSTFGTLVVTAFLAIASPTYARGGHGGGHGGIAVTLVGMLLEDMPPQVMLEADTLVSVLAVHVVTYVARAARGNARYAGRAYNWNGGRHWGGGRWGGNYWYPSSGYSVGYYGLGYGYPYYGSGYYGYRYGGYYPYYGNWGYYPYLYGYWPSVSFSFGY